MTVFYFYMHAFMALLVLQSNLPYFHVSLGWFITYSVVPKVQKFMVSGHFPIPLDPSTSPSEKFKKKLTSSVGASRLKFYSMIYTIAI